MLDLLKDYPDLLTDPAVAALLWVDLLSVYCLMYKGGFLVLRPTSQQNRVIKANRHRCLEAAHYIVARSSSSLHPVTSVAWREYDA
jgi:hypothetical protein